MTVERFRAITGKYSKLSIAVVGDFCLDRYLEIDPKREEISLETGLPVHNVVRVRAQPGGAGTVLNNLSALGVDAIFPVGFTGNDGEGFELRQALAARARKPFNYLFEASDRHTFTYCKPVVMESDKPPHELSRLDQKNWLPTPPQLVEQLRAAVLSLALEVDAFVLLSQVDQPETGVLTSPVLETFKDIAEDQPGRVIVADSRHSLAGFPPVIFKMNAAELAFLNGSPVTSDLGKITDTARGVAKRNNRPVFVTLAERGIVGVSPDGQAVHMPALPVRGEIDVVGAGDAVMANLTAAMAAGANIHEAIELANAAASIVIHQLGTTGSASLRQLRGLVGRG